MNRLVPHAFCRFHDSFRQCRMCMGGVRKIIGYEFARSSEHKFVNQLGCVGPNNMGTEYFAGFRVRKHLDKTLGASNGDRLSDRAV